MDVGVGRFGILNFPLLLLAVLRLVAEAVFGDTDVGTEDKPAGADSSSSALAFVFELDLVFFLDTLRREKTDHERF